MQASPQSSGKNQAPQKRKRLTLFDYINHLLLFLVLLICIIPFIYMLALSLSSPKAIMNNQVSLWPIALNFQSYQQIFNYPKFFEAYGNTFLYTIFGTLIALILTILFAYPLSKKFLHGNKLLMMMVVFSMFFSGGMIPTYLIIDSLRLVGTRWAMLLPFAVSPFNLIILVNFFKGIPQEIEEAALIDGLGYFGILRKIVLPLSTSALATVGLYYAVFFWNDWFNALLYLNSQQYPVMMFLRNIVNGTMNVGEGAGSADRTSLGISVKSAVIIVSTLPIIALYPILQRFFIVGLTVGSVKG